MHHEKGLLLQKFIKTIYEQLFKKVMFSFVLVHFSTL